MYSINIVKQLFSIAFGVMICGCACKGYNQNYHNSFFDIQSSPHLNLSLEEINILELQYVQNLSYRQEQEPSFKYKNIEEIRLDSYVISDNFQDFLARYIFLLREHSKYVSGAGPEFKWKPLNVKGF